MIRLAAFASLALLSACGSGGTNSVVVAIVGELRGRGPLSQPVEGAAVPPVATRAELEAGGLSAIRARLASDPVPTMLFEAAQNGPYETYLSNYRQSVTLRGSQITGTRGLGTDLLSAWSTTGDPLAQPVPPASWPAGVQRAYEFPAEGPRGRVETYQCRFEFGEVSEMTLLRVTHRGVEVSEYCSGPDGSFENLHFADLETGRVWRSLQWVGEDVGLVDLEILTP